MALTRGADHTREDLLGPCAAGRPIPATDLAIDDGGADGVFSAPVGRVDVGGPQEGEHSRELAVEMPGEALGRRQSGRRVDEPAQAGKQAPAGPSEALLGDRVGIPPIAEREGVGEDGLHAGCPRAPRMVGTERATPAEQMCQAALVQRAGKAAIGRPSVADQHTGEVRAQDRDRIVKATPGADRIHGGLRCRERPQPVQHGTDAPAGFIRTDDGTPPDLSAESRVRGRRYPGRAMQDLSKSSRRDRQPEPVLQQCCDLLQRHAHVFVQQDRKRHGARTELYACRAQGVGGLQPVPALHAVPACDAAPDLNVEPPHDWLDNGQVFLVLGRDASGLNRPTTARARHGKRRGIRLIHPRRNRSPAATSIGGTCPPARSPAATLRAVLRKRGGLSKARAPRRVELLLETLASSLPSIAIACRAGQLLTQAGNLILVALDQLVAFVARRSRALVDHACVMSYPRKLYKPNSLDLLPSPAKRRRAAHVHARGTVTRIPARYQARLVTPTRTAESIVLDVPSANPRVQAVLEASFERGRLLDEQDVALLTAAAQLGGPVLEAARTRSAARPADPDGAGSLIGSTPIMEALKERVERVASTDFTVLIEGESGTGKELVAGQLHELSRRRAGPFIAVNCAAVVETLLEAELFGIEERTATGVRGRRGKFEQAEGGTLFLDEASDLALSAQAKLLRAVQDVAVERVGGTGMKRIDNTRIVVATKGLSDNY